MMRAVLVVALLVMGATATAAAEGEQPSVVLHPQPSGPPGASIEVSGGGFEVGQRVEVRWEGSDGPLLAAAVGPDLATTMIVPFAQPGSHLVVVFSRDSDGVIGAATSTSFVVDAVPAGQEPPSPGDPPSAPNTATPREATSGGVWAAVVGILVLLAAGLARTRHHRPRPNGDRAVKPDVPAAATSGRTGTPAQAGATSRSQGD